MSAPFRRAAILGTGLIGGSFALALRKHSPDTVISGWDKEPVLRHARERGAIHEGSVDLPRAIAGADLVFLALPVGLTIEALPEVARRASPEALVTDASSTKRAVCAAAADCFAGKDSRFLGGHPMAGKEISGIAAADAELFRGAKYALMRQPGEVGNAPMRDARVAKFTALIQTLRAEPVWL